MHPETFSIYAYVYRCTCSGMWKIPNGNVPLYGSLLTAHSRSTVSRSKKGKKDNYFPHLPETSPPLLCSEVLGLRANACPPL